MTNPKELKLAFILLLSTNIFAQNQNLKDSFEVAESKVLVTNEIFKKKEILTIKINDEIVLQDTSEHNIFSSIEGNYDDFDKDGFKDIVITYSDLRFISNVYLYDSENKIFRKVKNFSWFPEAQKLDSATNLYYSYEATGCANDNWESFLFEIKDYTAIKIAEIQVDVCEFEIPKITYIQNLNPKEKIDIDSKEFGYKKNGSKDDFMKLFWTKKWLGMNINK